jgi:hypothetical protein
VSRADQTTLHSKGCTPTLAYVWRLWRGSGVGINGTSSLSRKVADEGLATSFSAFNFAYKVRGARPTTDPPCLPSHTHACPLRDDDIRAPYVMVFHRSEVS